MQFRLFWPFLGQFKHVGYKIACTRAEKFIGDTFTQFYAGPHAISCDFMHFHTISHIFYEILATMLGIKKHVPEPRNSLVILSRNFTHVFTKFHAILRKFHAIYSISALLGPISTCCVSKSKYSS